MRISYNVIKYMREIFLHFYGNNASFLSLLLKRSVG